MWGENPTHLVSELLWEQKEFAFKYLILNKYCFYYALLNSTAGEEGFDSHLLI